MKKVSFATGNKGKAHSVIQTAKRFGITVVHHRPQPELLEIQDPSYAKVACFKVKQASWQVETGVFCLDGGYEIEGLNGWPGTMTKPTLELLGVEHFLWLVKQSGNWRGKVRNALAYFDTSLTEPIWFEDSIPGVIIKEPRGHAEEKLQWSSLWHHFIPDGTELTFAELNEKTDHNREWLKKRDRGESIYSQFFTWLQNRDE